MSVRMFVALGVLLAQGAAGRFVEGQSTVVLEGEPVCDGCRIQLQPVVKLGLGDGGIRPAADAIIAADSRGGFFVFPTDKKGQLAYYSAEGVFQRSVGRPGPGPQEFDLGSVRMAVGTADTLFIVNGPYLHVVLPEARGMLDKSLLPSLNAMPVWTMEGLLAQYHAPGRGFYHHLRADSGQSRSFGTSPSTANPYDWIRKLAPAKQGGFWSAPVNRYELELWRADGQRTMTIRRSVPWFEPWVHEPNGARVTVPPNPQLVGMRETLDGKLWTITNVADADWKPAPRLAGEARERYGEGNDLYNGVIELIDVRSGQVVTTAQSKRTVGLVVGASDLVYDIVEGPDGNLEVHVFRLVLRSPELLSRLIPPPRVHRHRYAERRVGHCRTVEATRPVTLQGDGPGRTAAPPR